MVEHFAVSPDGNYLLVESLPEKLSQYIPYKKWGRQYQIVELNHGKSIYQLSNLADKINLAKSKDSVPLGARSVQWLPFKESTISWVETTHNGVLLEQSAINDVIYELASPFNKGKMTLLDVHWRYYDINWSKTGTAILQEWRYRDKQAKTYLLNYHFPQKTKLLSQRNYKDKYTDVGDPILRRTATGNLILVENDNLDVFLRASGHTQINTAPYIDAYNLKSADKKRLFSSKNNALETPIELNENNVFVRRESTNNPPSYLKLSGENFAEELLIYQRAVTNKFLTNTQIIQYQRSDGINLQGLLHLPAQPNQNKVKKIPAVLWVYPREFKSIKLSQQTTITQNKFISLDPSGPLPFLLDGIAVFEATAMPIISEHGEPNDNFIEQLVMNAQATVKALEKTGVIDVDRLAIMGHSYGAFSVANLLAHTDLFKAGIAKSGAYNRTLTPFGFQGERRTLWQARDNYLAISPFLYVDQIDEPLLLIHGENDLNSGTFPMQSRRMYQALVANKKTAKLIMLPYEGHSYRAKENLHLVLKQQSDWLKRWLNTSSLIKSDVFIGH
jgi:dienelactone hydrolase